MEQEFKSLRANNSGEGIDSKKMDIGASVEGYVTNVITTPSKKYPTNPHKTILITKEDGSKVALYAAANLRYLKEDMEKNGFVMGSFVRITRVNVPTGAKYKTFFDVSIKEGDVLDLSGGADENPDTNEY